MSSPPTAAQVAEACSTREPPPIPRSGEARTRWVVGITFVMMLAELIVGSITHSLALTADGWHMATHVGALGLTAIAYWYARTRAAETRFAFGTGKVYALAGFTSSTLLVLVSFEMMSSGVHRLFEPEAVNFSDALPVAIIGFVVNLVSAFLLGHSHGPTKHSSEHAHAHDHAHHDHAHHDHSHHDHEGGASQALRAALDQDGHDHNLRAAYLHVVADALTSVLAIVALVAGRYWSMNWLDPVVAIIASLVVLKWAWGLITDCARQLIDLGPSTELRDRIRVALEREHDTRVDDLHLWRVGPTQLVCVVSVSSARPATLADYKRAVQAVVPVDHLTIEIASRA